MFRSDVAQLVKALMSDDVETREKARSTLLALDEDAVEGLIDEYYAGVNDATGVAILEVVGEIGGPDAMSTLRNVFHFETARRALQIAAAQGLLHNQYSLSPHEIEDVKRFVAAWGDP